MSAWWAKLEALAKATLAPETVVVLGCLAFILLLLWAHVSRAAPTMHVTDLVLDVSDGRMSLAKTISLGSAVSLSVGFIKEAFARGLSWDDYLGFAVGMAVSASPTVAATVVSLRYGGKLQPGDGGK